MKNLWNSVQLTLTVFILTLSAFWLTFFSPAYAAEFVSSYDVKYYVQENGTTKVESTISLTNRITNLFAAEYHVTITGASIENVTAFDKKGPMKTSVAKSADQTKITAFFNEIVVGKGNTLTFTLSYQSNEIAKKVGRIWEITLPRVELDDSVSDYQATLSVARSLGEPLYVKPIPVKSKERDFTFTYDQLKKNIITAAFGESQIFSLELAYHLKNPAKETLIYQIALPPDTSYQRVVYSSIFPPPKTVEVDQDGNWLASYQLNPGERKDIKAAGFVEVFIRPRLSYPMANISDRKAQYLSASQYWQVSEEKITSLAARLKSPEAIYRYVVDNLSYDYSRVTNNASRLGAKTALEKPQQAICMEFADLTVALLRAAGIPAREVNGYAYTTNSKLRPLSLIADVLHAWPEYYDQEKEVWIPIDPTWGNTTGGIDYFSFFDLNHITFAIHGLSDSQPLPAGSYKLITSKKEEVTKDVHVEFTDKVPNLDIFPVKIEMEIPPVVITKGVATLTLTNPNGKALYNVPISIEGKGVKANLTSEKIDILPPWGVIKQPVELTPESFSLILLGKSLLTVEVAGVRSVFAIDSSANQSLILLLMGLILVPATVLSLLHILRKRKDKSL